MTFEGIVGLPMVGSLQKSWLKSIGYKLPLILISVLLLVVVWLSPPPSFLSYSQLSTSQIETILGSPGVELHYSPRFHSSWDSAANYDAHQESSPAEKGSSPLQEQSVVDPGKVVSTPASSESESNTNSGPAVEHDSPGSIEKESDSNTSPRPSAEHDSQAGIAKESEQRREDQVPRNETSIKNTTVVVSELKSNYTNPNNVTTEAVVPEDSQLVESELALQDAPQQPAEEGKYFMPALSFQVGTGNQLIEYKSAIVVARALNRTLCLAPFFIGPGRHFGYLGDRHSGLYMEERYDTEVLSKFVKVASMSECMLKCDKKLDAHWRLRKVSKAPQWGTWFNDTPMVSADFDRDAPKWSSVTDVAAFLGPRNQPKCIGIGGMFPGLRWRGVYFATSAYLQHSKLIIKAADIFQARALGSLDPNYVSVHWRYEESNCRGHPLGLCFSRCTDGAVIANGRRSETWENMTREGQKKFTKDGFNGVFVDKEDVSGAIHDRAVKQGVRNVYLATDGWLRGPESVAILKWVVEDIRSKGVNVAGLWQVAGLPNFADGAYVHSENIAELFGLEKKEKVSNHMIALVEQEICGRSAVFIGSGQSSWSLAVADTRRGHQCKRNIGEQIKKLNHDMSASTLDQKVIDKILSIQYTPGPTCRGSKNHTNLPIDVEESDGWLDYDSCEDRLLAGIGKCTRITT